MAKIGGIERGPRELQRTAAAPPPSAVLGPFEVDTLHLSGLRHPGHGRGEYTVVDYRKSSRSV